MESTNSHDSATSVFTDAQSHNVVSSRTRVSVPSRQPAETGPPTGGLLAAAC